MKEKLEDIKQRLKEYVESPVGKENTHADVIHREMAERKYPTEILDAARDYRLSTRSDHKRCW